jgi:hypothetical protein
MTATTPTGCIAACDVIPSALAHFPELPADTAGYFRWNGTTNKDGAVNPLQRCILKLFPDLTEEDRHRVIFANVPPTLTLGFRSDQISYFVVHADGVEVTVAEQGVLYAPGAMDEPLFEERRQANVQASVLIGAQDRHVDTLGAARAAVAACESRPLFLAGADAPRIQQWLVDRYRSTWRDMSEAGLRDAAE